MLFRSVAIFMGKGKNDEAEEILGNCTMALIVIALILVVVLQFAAEPLSLWRKEIYECYSPILDEFRKTDEADNPKVAAQLLMDTLRKANYRNTALFPVGPHLGPDVLKWHTGSCREFTDAMIYVLRALGIPCGVDRVMVLGDNNASHFWNFVLDKEGKTYIANLPYEEVWSKAEEYSISRGKMYRAT